MNLQRQLEIVQAQQQQILQQQHQLNQKAGLSSPSTNYSQNTLYPPGKGHHRRSSSTHQSEYETYSPKAHRRSQSSVSSIDGRMQALGHSRRHSLGLAEAKKAAAEVQAQRGYSPSKLSISSNSNSNSNSTTSEPASPPGLLPPASFKFPDEGARVEGHSRSRSINSDKSPQRNFQFPPRDNSSNVANLAPPQPSFAERHHSSGHRNSGSDVNNNWRRSQNFSSQGGFEGGFVPGHRARESYGSVSSISQFNQQGQRKSLFAPYLPQNSLPELINEGRLVTGTLRVNKKNRSDAYVSTDGLLDADIFICGSKDRNRALEGDLVAIELLVVDEVWSSKKEKEEKKRRKDFKTSSDTADSHNDASISLINDSTRGLQNATKLNRKGSLKQRPTQKKNDDVEVEGQSLLLIEEEEITDESRPLYAGHVVAVIDRIPGQLFSGTLGLLRPSQAAKHNYDNDKEKPRPKIVWFKPIDKKVPLIAIPTEQAPKDFIENHEKYANQTFIASIKRWPITSLHPFGTLVSRLGDQEDKQVEVESILRDNNFMCDEYTDGEEKYLLDFPSNNEVVKTGNRKDFTSDFVVACTQNDSFCDHAFHIKKLDSQKIELGVHIADVTEFIKNESNLDKRAKKRSHGVFLPQKSVNLFPNNINNEISFGKNKKSPTLSVVFEISLSNFEIEDVWIGEGLINPKQVASYDEIESCLQDNTEKTAMSDYIMTLSHVSTELKKKRLNSNTLDSSVTLPLLDQLDDERVKMSLNIYDKVPSAVLFDEIFRNVNSAVAQKVHAALGDRAFLRKFSIPTLTKFEYHQQKIEQLGITLDTTNAGTFQKSLLNIKDPITKQAVETILVKCMGRGKYVIAGNTDQDTFHYLFDLSVYTHFNAPLRRYADLIVHRQLKHVINHNIDQYLEDMESLKMNSDYCNFKKDCSKAAQEQSIHLLLCQVINDMSSTTGQILCTGVVLQVYESSFDVFLPEFGIEKRVHGDQLPLVKAEFDNEHNKLELYWEPGVDSAVYVPADERKPLSYRNSIKNKYRASIEEVKKTQLNSSLLSKEMKSILDNLSLCPPENDYQDDILKNCITRIENGSYIQEIKLLQRVPILLRSEIGMSLPCLTVKTLNPFADVSK